MNQSKPCIFCQGLKMLTIVEFKRRVVCPVCGGSGVFYYVDLEEIEHGETTD